MSAIQRLDELQRVIDRHVAQGLAARPAAFIEEAVMRLVDDALSGDESIQQAAEAGLADTATGR